MDDAHASIDSHSRKEVLVAYLHLAPGTPTYTRAVLEGHIERFAEREGYLLDRIIVFQDAHAGRAAAPSGANPPDAQGAAVSSPDDALTVRELLEHTRRCGASAVLVAGPGRAALVALQLLRNVRVLTLADVRPSR